MPTATLAFSLKDDSLVKQVRIHPEQDTAEVRHMLRHIYNIYLNTHIASIHTCTLDVQTVTHSKLKVYQTEQLHKNNRKTYHSEKL